MKRILLIATFFFSFWAIKGQNTFSYLYDYPYYRFTPYYQVGGTTRCFLGQPKNQLIPGITNYNILDTSLHIFLMQENGKLLWSKFLDIKNYSEGINFFECNNAKPIFLTDTSILFTIYFSPQSACYQGSNLLLNVNLNGDIIWHKTLKCGAFYPRLSNTCLTNDNGFIGNNYLDIVQFNADGSIRSQVRNQVATNVINNYYLDFVSFNKKKNSNNYIGVLTLSDSLQTTCKLLLVETDSIGRINKTKSYILPDAVYILPKKVANIDNENGVYVGCELNDTILAFIHFDSLFNVTWKRQLTITSCDRIYIGDINICNNDDVFFTGTKRIPFNGNYPLFIKFNKNGQLLHLNCFTDSLKYRFNALSSSVILNDGSIVSSLNGGHANPAFRRIDSALNGGCYTHPTTYSLTNLNLIPGDSVIFEDIPTPGYNLITNPISLDNEKVLVYDNCTNQYLSSYSLIYPTGINNLSANYTSIRVFPNPVEDQFMFNFNNDIHQSGTLFIYDVSGRLIMKQEINDVTNTSIDVHHLNRGMYFIKLKDEHTTYSGQIIKK